MSEKPPPKPEPPRPKPDTITKIREGGGKP